MKIKTNALKVANNLTQMANTLSAIVGDSMSQEATKLIGKLKSELEFAVNDSIMSASTGPNKSKSIGDKIAGEASIGKTSFGKEGSVWHNDPQSQVLESFKTKDENDIMRVKFDIDKGAPVTYEGLKSDFERMLIEKPLGIQGSDGLMRYYALSGPIIDQLLNSVKIFCSELRDSDTDEDGNHIGRAAGKDKFDRDRNKGFTEFTLKAEALKLVDAKNPGVTDVTPVIDMIKHGRYEEALGFLSKAGNSKSAAAISDRVKKISNSSEEQTPESTKARQLGDANRDIARIRARTTLTTTTVKINTEISTSDLSFIEDLSSRKAVENTIKREAEIFKKSAVGPITMAGKKALDKTIIKWNSSKEGFIGKNIAFVIVKGKSGTYELYDQRVKGSYAKLVGEYTKYADAKASANSII